MLPKQWHGFQDTPYIDANSKPYIGTYIYCLDNGTDGRNNHIPDNGTPIYYADNDQDFKDALIMTETIKKPYNDVYIYCPNNGTDFNIILSLIGRTWKCLTI